jgi:tetratricopeptide (TPR) repeat protein
MLTALQQVKTIQELVTAEQTEEAIAAVRELQTHDVRDARFHLKVADLCEALGLGERVVAELNLAYRDSPDDVDILKRLAGVHADAGREERALKCWRAVVERRPADVEAWEELGASLTEMARIEEALDTYVRALQQTGDKRFAALSRALTSSRFGAHGQGGGGGETEPSKRALPPKNLGQPNLEGVQAAAGASAGALDADEGDLPWLGLDEPSGGDDQGAHRTTQGEPVYPDALLAGSPSLDDAEAQPATPSIEALASDDSILVRFVSLFNGREGVYARQWITPERSTGYTPVREPFTASVARNHLLGNHTVGIYPVRLDNTVNFVAIDLDVSKAVAERGGPGGQVFAATMQRIRQYAARLYAVAAEHGLNPHLEESGYKGYHLWIFFYEPIPARIARTLGSELCRVVGPPGPDIGVEVFPKQASLPPNSLGNLIKLPLGIHRLTGRRALFTSSEGQAVANLRDYLGGLRRTDRTTVLRFVEQVAPRLGAPAFDEDLAPFDLDAGEHDGRERGRSFRGEGGFVQREPGRAGEASPSGVRGQAEQVHYHLDNDPEYLHVLSRCAVLREIAGTLDAHGTITNDEAMVVIHSLGHLSTGPHIVNALLRKCPGVDPTLFLKSRLRGNPMSCPKIRSRIPDITSKVGCNCEFVVGAGLYPTPGLHLQTRGQMSADTELGTLQFQALMQDYFRVRKTMHELQRQHDKLQASVARWFDNAGIDELKTPFGVLRRHRADDGSVTFLLEV